jgi:hypothetical protein
MNAINAILTAGATLLVVAALQTPAAAQGYSSPSSPPTYYYVQTWPAQAPNPAVSNYYTYRQPTPNAGFVGATVPSYGTPARSIQGPTLNGVQLVGAPIVYARPPAVQSTWPTQFVAHW